MCDLKTQISSTDDIKLSLNYLKESSRHPQGSERWYALLDSSIEANPLNAAAVKERSVFYTKTGDYVNAYKWLDKAVEIDPNELGYRGWLKLYKLHDYEGALEDLEKFFVLVPGGNKYAWGEHVKYLTGLARKGLGQYEEASMDFTQFIEEETNRFGEKYLDPLALVYRGICFKEMKNVDGALKEFDRAINISKSCPEALYQKALLQLEYELKPVAHSCQLLKETLELAQRGNISSNPYKDLFDQIYVKQIESLLDKTCSD